MTSYTNLASQTSQIQCLPNATNPWSLEAAVGRFANCSGHCLTPNGCAVNGSTARNCSQACTDPSILFGRAAATLGNCLAYPIVSADIGLNPGALDPGSDCTDLGILPNDTQTSVAIIKVSMECLQNYTEWCTEEGPVDDPSSCPSISNDPACSQFFNRSVALGRFYIEDNLQDSTTSLAYSCFRNYCSFVANIASINPDIGGLGVYISYMMQVAVCLAAWILAVYWFREWHPWRMLSRQKEENKRGTSQADTVIKKHQENLTDAVEDFQTTQCWFMLTIQIASIIEMATKDGLSADSLQQIWNNFAFLTILAIGGCLPVTFILFVLRSIGRLKRSVVLLATVTFIMSSATLFYATTHTSLTNDLLPPPPSPFTCSGPSPLSLCLEGFGGWTPGLDFSGQFGDLISTRATGALPPYIYSLIVLLVIWVEIVLRTVCSQHILHEYGTDAFWQRFLPNWAPISALALALRFALAIIYIYFFGAYISNLRTYSKSGDARFSDDTSESPWSFGQIVALTVWVPSLVHWAYLELQIFERQPSFPYIGHRVMDQRNNSTQTERPATQEGPNA